MKKILLITNHSYMLYRFRRELIQHLMKDYQVVLCMPFVGHEDDFMQMGLACIETDMDRRGMNPLHDFRLMEKYWKIISREKPDVVITYSIKPNVYGGLICALKGIPYFVNVQGLGTAFQKKGIAEMVTLMYWAALRKAKTVFFENEGNAQVFLDKRIVKQPKIQVLPGAGINLQEFSYAPYPKNEAVHFLYLGRIMQEKGVGELFNSMRRLHDKLGNRVVLDLVGFFEDDYQAEIDSLVKDGIAVFHGFQTEPKPFYEQTDCVVLPSYHEGLSNVLLESAAIGRPVITTNIHGCMEAVDPGETGLLCRVRDSESLYQQMLRMAEMPREEREAMGRAGRYKMELIFDKNLVVDMTAHAMLDL